MNIQALQKRLEVWKKILFINTGASLALFIQAVMMYQESGSLMFETSWYAVWFIVQLAAFLPGFVLLWGKHWMQIPLSERLSTIFGYFAVAWFNLLPIAVRVNSYESKTLNFLWLGGAIALTSCYWWLHRMLREFFP